jgi:hypothetical protein
MGQTSDYEKLMSAFRNVPGNKNVDIPAFLLQDLGERAFNAERGRRQAERKLEEYLSQDRVAVARAADLERMVDILQAENARLRKSSWYSRLGRRILRTTLS